MRSPAQHPKARYETSLLIYFLSSLCHPHKIAAASRGGSGSVRRPEEPSLLGRAVSEGSKCSRSTSCFELAWGKEQPARRACAAPAPRDGHTDVGKLAVYYSSINFTVVRVVLFLLPGWQTRTVNIFNGLELGLLARWDGCGRWVGPAGLLSRLAS